MLPQFVPDLFAIATPCRAVTGISASGSASDTPTGQL